MRKHIKAEIIGLKREIELIRGKRAFALGQGNMADAEKARNLIFKMELRLMAIY